MTNVDPDNEATFLVHVIASNVQEASKPKEAILGLLKQHSFSKEATFAVKLALEEALTNAIKHGNGYDPSKTVTVRYAVSPEKVVVIVRDEGHGFAPEDVPDCTAPERLRQPDGRGIMLMESYMDEVSYRDGGREIRLMKRRD